MTLTEQTAKQISRDANKLLTAFCQAEQVLRDARRGNISDPESFPYDEVVKAENNLANSRRAYAGWEKEIVKMYGSEAMDVIDADNE